VGLPRVVEDRDGVIHDLCEVLRRRVAAVDRDGEVREVHGIHETPRLVVEVEDRGDHVLGHHDRLFLCPRGHGDLGDEMGHVSFRRRDHDLELEEWEGQRCSRHRRGRGHAAAAVDVRHRHGEAVVGARHEEAEEDARHEVVEEGARRLEDGDHVCRHQKAFGQRVLPRQ